MNYSFGDLFDLYAGGDVDRSHYSPVKYGKYTVPIYANAFQNHGLYGFTDKARYPNNSVTISGRGDIGHAEYRSEAFDAIIRLLVLVPKKENTVDCRYFAELVNTYIKFPSESTGVPQLTTVQIKNIEFSLPEYDEQRAIATALSDTDALIDSLEKLIAKKQAIKQGTMQELLTGKRRLKGFSGEWKEKELQAVANTMSGGTPSRNIEAFYSGNIPWVTTSELIDTWIYDTKEHISEEAIKKSSAKVFPAGTVLMAMYGATIGKLGIIAIDAATNQACCAFFPNEDELDSSFLYFWLMYNRNYFVMSGVGAGQPNISQRIIQHTGIELPSLKEQRSIAQILTDMDDEISALQKKLDKLRRIKQGMMAELLTGRIRLI